MTRRVVVSIGGARRWRWPAGRRWVAVIAALGQMTLLLATGADAWRGGDVSPHIERAGTHLHHAHDEASCVACAGQTLHAHHSRPALEWPGAAPPQDATSQLASVHTSKREYPSNGSRAPPLMN